jgi:uncharacterized membrane protein YphA (DoxX/SURF4 family)
MKHTKSCTPVMILRVFFGIAFIVAGLDKIFSFSMAKDMFEGIFGSIGGALLILTLIVELAGGIALVTGFHTRITASVLALVMVVALISTFKIGESMHFIGTLREILVMNTGGANTAATLAYLAALLSLTFSGSDCCAVKRD